MSEEAVAMAPEFEAEEMPLPFGVTAAGKPLNDLKAGDWKSMDKAPTAVSDRGRDKKVLVFAEGVKPNELSSAGWGIVYAKDTDPAVIEALKPLIEHRRALVNNETIFREFIGSKAVQSAKETPRGWVTRHGADFIDVQPSNGVPLYLMLVGPPDQIPFEFQYGLDSYWNVGRLDFDTPAEYATYAQNVIAYETAKTIANRKKAVLWNAKNPGDNATGLLHNLVATPLVNGQGAINSVGKDAGFALQPLLADAATKPALLEVLNGNDTPALLYTGSHGVAFPDASEQMRRDRQGALLCQEWSRGADLTEDQYLTGAEILAQAKVPGMIHFLFACYGGGCPAFDNYQRDGNNQPMPLMPKPVTARVPQAMLQKGALAVLAHVDRAWSFGFQSLSGRAQYQGFRSVMDKILNGERIGQATDAFNQRWGTLSHELLDLKSRREDGEAISDSVLSNRWVARNDARNYIILGDPAVQLRVNDMRP